jgi:pyruvate/2-oxoglutarate/acetoin dehydrogenase E1 component
MKLGLITIAPYDVIDARGLLKAGIKKLDKLFNRKFKLFNFMKINNFFYSYNHLAIRNPNPVVFLENEIMYGESFTVDDSVMNMDFVEPIGKARIMREGKLN